MKLATLLLATVVAGVTPADADAAPPAETGFVRLDEDITLRHLVVRNPHAKSAVLFLHGFPESSLAFRDIAMRPPASEFAATKPTSEEALTLNGSSFTGFWSVAPGVGVGAA